MKKNGGGTVWVKASSAKYGVVCGAGLLKRAGLGDWSLGEFRRAYDEFAEGLAGGGEEICGWFWARCGASGAFV